MGVEDTPPASGPALVQEPSRELQLRNHILIIPSQTMVSFFRQCKLPMGFKGAVRTRLLGSLTRKTAAAPPPPHIYF